MGRKSRALRTISVSMALLLPFACAQASQSSATPIGGCSALNLTDQSAGTSTPTSTIAQITFYGDLLPILNLGGPRRGLQNARLVHAQYATPAGLNAVSTINQVIDSMQTKSMPRAGDVLPDEKINLFRVWQLQGFQPGVPGKVTPGAGLSPGLSGTTGNCAN